MAPKDTRLVRIVRIGRDGIRTLSDPVIVETPVTIFLNDVELVTLMCSPSHLDELAAGFLFTEGVISGRRDIAKIAVDNNEGAVWLVTKGRRKRFDELLSRRLITTGCGRGLSFHDPTMDKKLEVRSDLRIQPVQITALMREFQQRSDLYRLTGGAHSAAVCLPSGVVIAREDIGRHSAVDKALGRCVLDGTSTTDAVLVTSGRISSEMIVKAARADMPVIVSKSAPTALAVSLAKDFGITLVGFVRGTRMNVYSHPERADRS